MGILTGYSCSSWEVQLSASVTLIFVTVTTKFLLTFSIHVWGGDSSLGWTVLGPLLGHCVINQNARGSRAAAGDHFCVHSRVLTATSLRMWCLPFLHKPGEQKSPLLGESVTLLSGWALPHAYPLLNLFESCFPHLLIKKKKKKGFTYLIYKIILSTWKVYVNIRQMWAGVLGMMNNWIIEITFLGFKMKYNKDL